jgi:hypothetical protein
MKIKYWCLPLNYVDEKLTPREEDGRVLKTKALIDFLYSNIYGELDQYSAKEVAAQYVNLAIYDVLAEAGILTIEKLKEILKTAYQLRHPNEGRLPTFNTLDSFCED